MVASSMRLGGYDNNFGWEYWASVRELNIASDNSDNMLSHQFSLWRTIMDIADQHPEANQPAAKQAPQNNAGNNFQLVLGHWLELNFRENTTRFKAITVTFCYERLADSINSSSLHCKIATSEYKKRKWDTCKFVRRAFLKRFKIDAHLSLKIFFI